MDTEISNKIKGTIFGQALGDAIGLATEYMTRSDVHKNYTSRSILLDGTFTFDDIVQDYHRSVWKKGDWTDDTDLLVVGIQSFIESNGEVNTHIFKKNLDKWYSTGIPECGDSKPYGCGYTMNIIWGDPYFKDNDTSLSARRAYMYNPTFPCCLSSNGGIMRTSWIGTANYKNLDLLAYHTIENCAVTHSNPKCVASSLFLNFLIAEILKNSKDIDLHNIIELTLKNVFPYLAEYTKIFNISIMRDVNKCKEDDPFYSVIRENYKFFKPHSAVLILDELREYINKKKLEDLDLDNIEHWSYTFIPLAVSIISLRKIVCEKQDFLSVIMDIVKMGGDADTNCAITGALCGTYVGFDKLPQTLIETMPYKTFLKNLTEEYMNVIK